MKMFPIQSIYSIKNLKEFQNKAIELFRQQYQYIEVYHDFIDHLGINPAKVDTIDNIPFLPVELFKYHKILDKRYSEKIIFSSSGTTGMTQSKHYLPDPNLYETSFVKTFEMFYGPVNDYCILALLPSYLEREGSSLVYMMDRLIKLSRHKESGFYLQDTDKLMLKIRKLTGGKKKILLMGVSFALQELAEKYQEDLGEVIIMETGGMKGRRKEITRQELHEAIKKSFNVESVHSEYGMTELMSQAYSKGEGFFHFPSWMKIIIRDSHDPFDILPAGKSGVINIIDLANVYSCAFLATSDLGKSHKDGSFEVLGRMDSSDIRGCNLLITD
jgi:phenylacetate-coenzyme A ligase PaaK-like adenylate-forming protein